MQKFIIGLLGILNIIHPIHAMETASAYKVLNTQFESERMELQMRWHRVKELCNCLNDYDIFGQGTNARNPYTGRTVLLEVISLFKLRDYEQNDDVRNEIKEMIELFLQRDADVNGTDNFGNNPLICAAESKYSNQIFPLLLDAGARVNYQHPRTGITALMSASTAGCIPSVTMLMRRADIDLRLTNQRGNTAADQVNAILRALPQRKEDFEYIYKLLIGEITPTNPIS